MNLRHLRAFAAIVDAGGFARAAARLNLSQPALSRQIHALESDLGVPLFDRIGRRALLTSEGEGVRTASIFRRGEPLGQWASVSWDPRRFLAPYAEQFVEELVAYARQVRPWPASPGARRRCRGPRNQRNEP